MDRDSSVWLFFTKKAPFTATCNTCSQDYSYRASTSNLRKHWYNKHGGKRAKVFEAKPSEVSGNTSSTSDEEQDKAVTTNVKPTKSMVTWKFFDPLDPEKYEATCTICGKIISFKHFVDLKHHVQEHGYEPMDSDEEFVPEIQEIKLLKRRKKSKLWEYFRITDDKMAECLMCHNLLNYGSTITNLRRHLMRKHEEAALSCQNDPKVEYTEETFEFVEEDNDDQQKSLDAIYINEEHLEDSFDDEIKPPLPKKKLINIPTKRTQKITKEQVHRSRDTCSEEPEQLRKSIPKNTPTNTMGSLDYFGQYVISLLKELPKTVSDQLQNDACEELLKVTDVWSYFDTDSGKTVKCTICHTSVGNEYDELKAHLKDNHPKLLLRLLQNKDQESDAGSGSAVDDDNTYTEIVYLEQDSPPHVPKPKEKPKTFQQPAKKRERLQNRYSSDESPVKKQKQEEENDELSSFVNYITCLLKKLPADVFSNVQIDIINTILKAKSQAANTSFSMELPNTSSNNITVDETVPPSTGTTSGNYTITVTPSKELNTTENCN